MIQAGKSLSVSLSLSLSLTHTHTHTHTNACLRLAEIYFYYLFKIENKIIFFIYEDMIILPSVQFSSVAQSCLTLCYPMNRSTPGFPVHHKLLEFTQTHVHQVGDAIQPSHPLSSPSPPAPNPSQHQGLFQ